MEKHFVVMLGGLNKTKAILQGGYKTLINLTIRPGYVMLNAVALDGWLGDLNLSRYQFFCSLYLIYIELYLGNNWS